MLRASVVACVSLSLGLYGCGSKVPQHIGQKKAPWKKAKSITLEDNLGTSKGELDYGDYKRAKWLKLDLVENGNLTLDLDFTPTDDAGDATVAMEVLDAGFNVISEDEDAPLKAVEPEDTGDDEDAADDEEDDEEDEDDEESDEGSGETQKTRNLAGLEPGKYYVHLFVVKRLDAAEYKLAVKFEPVIKEVDTGFPKDVAWAPSLPIVPLDDDAPPPTEKKPDKKPDKHKPRDKTDKPDKPDDEPVSTGSVSAAIIDIKVSGSGSGTDIVFSAGTDAGLAPGRKGSIGGVKKGGSFTISSCTSKSCKASVSASVDDVNRSKKTVTIK